MTVFRLNPKMSTSEKITKFETFYCNKLLQNQYLPMYVKLTTSVGYTICEIKDVTGAKKTVILKDAQLANMVIGNVYYIKEIEFSYMTKQLFILSSASIMLATSDMSNEFINIPCGDFSCNKILDWDNLTEYNSCPVDKKKLTDEFVCSKCLQTFENDDENIKDWIVHLIVMNSTEDGTRTVLLFKRNFNIILDNISISDQLETLIGIEFVLEYSSHYNSSDQFVCDKLNRMKINLQKKDLLNFFYCICLFTIFFMFFKSTCLLYLFINYYSVKRILTL
jgi:hypothetical protein